jgi:hypothetical protein
MQLVKMKLNQKSLRTIELIKKLTGDSNSTIISQSISMYYDVLKSVKDGDHVTIMRNDGGSEVLRPIHACDVNRRKLKIKDVIVFVKKPGGGYYYNEKDVLNWIGHIGVVIQLDSIRILTQCDHGFCLTMGCDSDEIEYIGKLE